ncbi:MAG: transporter substrate-binding domain-containing protein, partial [Synergistaceae bacterium]|nr:transporter substrate-binding domain-containing protein [Synergistaceae bacterium]
MNRRTLIVILIVSLLAPCFTAQAALDYSDFAGEKIGVIIGSICDKLSEDGLGATPLYYSRTAGAIRGVRNGEIAGFMTDLLAARKIVGNPGNEDLRYVELPPEIFTASIGAISASQEITRRFNFFLAKSRADGTLADIRNRWMETEPAPDARIPDIPLTDKNGTLRIATDGDGMPFAY